MEDCATQERPLPRLFPWSWLCTFRGDCLPYISQWHHWHSTPARYTGSACVSVCVFGKTRGLGERRAVQTGLHNRLHANASFGKKFPSSSGHALLKDSSSLDLNSTETVHDSCALLIKAIKYVNCDALFAGRERWHGSGKSAGESSCPSNHRGPVKSDPTWMNEHGPADRGRSQRRKSAEDYCSTQSRDGTEATEANMTPVICTWFLFYNCKLLKVRMQLVSISRNGGKKHTCVLHVPQRINFFFLLRAIHM